MRTYPSARLAVSNSVQTLTATSVARSISSTGQAGDLVVFSVSGNSAHIRFDSTAATKTTGILFKVDNRPYEWSGDLSKMTFAGTQAASATTIRLQTFKFAGASNS